MEINVKGKIRILQFPIANSKGGITQYILQNWKFIDKSKFQFDFATMSKSLDFADELEKEGCKIHYISCYAEQDRERFIDEFSKILFEGNYDVVHLHTKQWKSFLVEQIAKEVGVKKIIIHAHSAGIDSLDEQRRKKEEQIHNWVLEQLTENIATDFWTCSNKATDFIFGKQIPRERIKFMPNAIELDKYTFNQKTRNQYRKEYGLENYFVIGHVGRFVYPKNHEFLVEVFYELSRKMKRVRLLFLGEGQLLPQIQEKVKKIGIDDKVLFLGRRDDVNNWYQVMDIFCLPSWFEGLPISMVEAQASGLYCIGSDCITEEVKIAKKITLLPLEKEVWIKELEKNSKIRRENVQTELMLQKYDIKTQIKNIEREYESV